MNSHSLVRSCFCKTVAIILSMALIFSAVPLKEWSTLSGVKTAYAAPSVVDTSTAVVNSPVTKVSQGSDSMFVLVVDPQDDLSVER